MASGWVPRSPVSRTIAVLYVLVVAGLAAKAWSQPSGGNIPSEIAAMVLTLPALIAGLPLVYVLGAAAWNATGADTAGPMWPVTLVYAAVFAAIAMANVALVQRALTRRRERVRDGPA